MIFLLTLGACASPKVNQATKVELGTEYFMLKDPSGYYNLRRDTKIQNGKIILRQTIFQSKSNKALEKSITVSKIGNLKNGKRAVLPDSSQFEVWFSGKKYESKIKLNRQTRTVDVFLKSPEKKWNGKISEKISSARVVCFFSQLPECLKTQNMLLYARNKKVPVLVIWDNYPYYSEQYSGLAGELITQGFFSFSEKLEDNLRFELDLGSQIIFYHFNQKLKFVKMNWVSQGITLEANSNGVRN